MSCVVACRSLPATKKASARSEMSNWHTISLARSLLIPLFDIHLGFRRRARCRLSLLCLRRVACRFVSPRLSEALLDRGRPTIIAASRLGHPVLHSSQRGPIS
jgi:hypothetical protein